MINGLLDLVFFPSSFSRLVIQKWCRVFRQNQKKVQTSFLHFITRKCKALHLHLSNPPSLLICWVWLRKVGTSWCLFCQFFSLSEVGCLTKAEWRHTPVCLHHVTEASHDLFQTEEWRHCLSRQVMSADALGDHVTWLVNYDVMKLVRHSLVSCQNL